MSCLPERIQMKLLQDIIDMVGHSDNYWSDKTNTPYTTTDGDIIRYCIYTIIVLVVSIFVLLGVTL